MHHRQHALDKHDCDILPNLNGWRINQLCSNSVVARAVVFLSSIHQLIATSRVPFNFTRNSNGSPLCLSTWCASLAKTSKEFFIEISGLNTSYFFARWWPSLTQVRGCSTLSYAIISSSAWNSLRDRFQLAQFFSQLGAPLVYFLSFL